MKIKAHCMTCLYSRFSIPSEADLTKKKYFECHRHAPIVTNTDDTLFPIVDPDNWCGDYEVSPNLLKESEDGKDR